MEWWLAPLTNWVAIGSGLATTVLVIIVLVQLYLTKKEMTLRQRPWIMPVKIEPTHITLQNGDTLGFNEAQDVFIQYPNAIPDITHYQITLINSGVIPVITHYQITLINSGTIPAKISYVLFDQKEKFSRDAFENKLMDKSVTITPNYNYDEGVDVLAEDLEPGKNYYVGISLEYIANNKTVKSGAIYQLKSNRIDLVENWHD